MPGIVHLTSPIDCHKGRTSLLCEVKSVTCLHLARNHNSSESAGRPMSILGIDVVNRICHVR